MANYRLVVTTKRGDVVYTAFSEVSQADLSQLIDLCKELGRMNYFNITDEDGDMIFIQGDAIESIKIEKLTRLED